MEIKNLKTFVQVAQVKNFTKAAQILGYTQSTVSFQIKQLENELNCTLFDRINHNITLTSEGQKALEYAQNVLNLTADLKENFKSSAVITGNVHIVTSDSICEMMMLRNYYDFYLKYPGIALEFSTADTNEMTEKLDHNLADLIFTLDNHIYRAEYVIEKEEPVDLHFVVGTKSPLAKTPRLQIEDLLAYPFFLTEKNMTYRKILDERLAQRSLEVKPVLQMGRTDIITYALENGAGVSFLPDFVTREKVRQGKLALLDIEGFDIVIWKQLIRHKNKWLSAPLKALIEYIKCKEFEK